MSPAWFRCDRKEARDAQSVTGNWLSCLIVWLLQSTIRLVMFLVLLRLSVSKHRKLLTSACANEIDGLQSRHQPFFIWCQRQMAELVCAHNFPSS